jgi:hypothetical protein
MLEHERAIGVGQNRKYWYAIFQGTNARRTLIAS